MPNMKKDHPLYNSFRQRKCQAKKRGIPFEIDLEDLPEIPDVCPALGVPMVRPSIDRIDPKKGYVKGNVTVISSRANRIKNDGTADEHERIARWMRQAIS